MSAGRRLGRCLIACVLVVVGLPLSAAAQNGPEFTPEEHAWIAQHPVVRVAYRENWKPFEYIEQGKPQGLASSYLDAISRVSGLRFKPVPINNWAQSRNAFLQGEVDLLPSLSTLAASDALKQQLLLTDQYFMGATLAVARASQRTIFHLDELDGMTVAIIGGGATEILMREKLPRAHLLLFDSTDAALQAVADGSADVAAATNYAAEPLLRRRFASELHVSGVLTDLPVPLFMGVHADQPLLRSILDKSLHALTAADTDVFERHWLEVVDYGAPSYGSILRYRARELALVVAAIVGILFLAWRARVQRQRAERSEREKARFLAVMSHEIRTPMNAILSSVELLQRTPLDDKQKRLTDVATTASQTLLVLLDDVLDISKLEAQRVALELLPTPILPWINEALDVVRWRAERKGLALTFMSGVDPSLCLRIDPTRTRQILLNLLSNAVKFTEHGGVTVRMSYVPAAKRGAAGTFTIDVADTGVGIAQKDQHTIFKAFQQADSSTTRRFGGTGLGLSISRELVRLMHGKIEVQSTPGAGTVFTVTLPAEVATAEEAQAAARPITDERTLTIAPEPIGLPDAVQQTELAKAVSAQTSKPRPRVLVVDDQPTNLMVIEDQLHTLGCDVELAADGAQALEKAAAQTFDLILMDCYLPDIDGYAVTARIRAREAGAGIHTPILAISAAVDDEHQQRVMESGMDGMLTKPIRLDALRDMIDLWCDVAGSDDSPSTPRVTAPTLAGEDRDLWSIYLDSLDDDLESLAHALNAHDPDAARYVAHRIKGAALTVEQAAIAERARVLEAALAQAGTIPADAPAALAELRRLRDQLRADSTVG
ncbi:two-component system, NarL family, sensor histidine kinase EvgS [Ralstonia sp. 151470066-2]|nr:response regulator [Ralstonia insidiosa]MBA9873561.1 response regulator [Ralstonia insidiosa]MBA9916281.1 response regulator [Ralstonia insidiosa]MBA9940652.1 response regulator [Ralstonia insidiosa]MBA9955400.1 response regulator [Ralstonia insidiosa]